MRRNSDANIVVDESSRQHASLEDDSLSKIAHAEKSDPFDLLWSHTEAKEWIAAHALKR